MCSRFRASITILLYATMNVLQRYFLPSQGCNLTFWETWHSEHIRKRQRAGMTTFCHHLESIHAAERIARLNPATCVRAKMQLSHSHRSVLAHIEEFSMPFQDLHETRRQKDAAHYHKTRQQLWRRDCYHFLRKTDSRSLSFRLL